VTTRWRALGVLLCAVLALGACQRRPRQSPSAAATAASFPLQTRDDAGRTVVLPRRPHRIVTLLPSFTETVFALGAGADVVGVDDYSDYPPEVARLPKLGGAYDTHVEQVLALAPDLVLLSPDSKAAATLAQNGLVVWAGDARQFADVFRVIAATGGLLDRPAEARRLIADMQRQLGEIEASVRRVPRVSVYYELDATPYSVGPRSFVGVLLDKAGGQNIVPDGLGDFPKLNPELIFAEDPSVILGTSWRELAARPGWNRLRAVKERRVYEWAAEEGHLISRPGPRLPQALRALVRKLHPELG